MILYPKIKTKKQRRPLTPIKKPQTNKQPPPSRSLKRGWEQQKASKNVKTLPQDGYSGCWDLDLPYQSPFLQYYSLRPTFPEK